MLISLRLRPARSQIISLGENDKFNPDTETDEAPDTDTLVMPGPDQAGGDHSAPGARASKFQPSKLPGLVMSRGLVAAANWLLGPLSFKKQIHGMDCNGNG